MTQKPVAWAVTACSRMFVGEFAEFDAKAEALRCGGTCVAYALYSAPVVAQQAEQGWVRVPLEPTKLMLRALIKEWDSVGGKTMYENYKAMLKAAPKG